MTGAASIQSAIRELRGQALRLNVGKHCMRWSRTWLKQPGTPA